MTVLRFCFPILLLTAVFIITGFSCFAQSSADNRTPMFGDKKERQPKPVLEMFEKRRIEREQKEYDEMIEKGDELLSITAEIRKAFEVNGRLSDRERTQLAAVEKLSKQIRSSLGGGDDGSRAAKEVSDARQGPLVVLSAFSEAAGQLVDELKKTTRFTISASAIESSNSVLGLARLLRSSK